jgi:hypothetical protein
MHNVHNCWVKTVLTSNMIKNMSQKIEHYGQISYLRPSHYIRYMVKTIYQNRFNVVVIYIYKFNVVVIYI